MPQSPSSRNNDPIYAAEARTPDATPFLLFTTLTYPSGVYKAKVYVNACNQATNDAGGWEISLSFQNILGVVSIIGMPTFVAADLTFGASTWNVTFSGAGSYLQTYVVGQAGQTIKWRGDIQVKRLELIK